MSVVWALVIIDGESLRVNGWLTQVNELADWQGVVMWRMRIGRIRHMLILCGLQGDSCATFLTAKRLALLLSFFLLPLLFLMESLHPVGCDQDWVVAGSEPGHRGSAS